MRTPQRVEFIRVPQQQQAVAVQPAQLLVDSQMNPISLVYRSHGAAINILQKHIPSKVKQFNVFSLMFNLMLSNRELSDKVSLRRSPADIYTSLIDQVNLFKIKLFYT